METYTYQKTLPSCTLNRSLLADIEKRLLIGIPKLLANGLRNVLQGLGLKDHHKLESYQVVIDARDTTRTIQSSRELDASWFEPGTRQVSIQYTLGAPRIIAVEIVFSQSGRATIAMATQSPQIQSCLMLTVPALVMLYGLFSGVDLMLLYASMGWLCLLSLGMTMLLPRLFPWVTFEMQGRFQLSRLPLLAKVSMLSIAIACYIGLIMLNLPHTSQPPVIMFAAFGG
jgi:hypothetical protein